MINKVLSKTATLGLYGYQNAKTTIDCFEQNCRIIGLTRGQFSLIDLITAILEKTGKADVICCTWSAGIKDAKQMYKLKNDGNINLFKIVTDHSYVTRQKQYAISLEGLFGKENIATTEIHAKFTLIKNDKFNVVIRTSMNLNANKTCENYEIDDNIEIFNFYQSFLNGIFENMPKGFTASSTIVNNSLNKVFNSNNKEETISGYIW